LQVNKQAPTCDPGDHPKHRRARLVSDDALERAARIFRALGEKSRLRIVAVLAQGEACVTELARTSDDSLSTVSQRLRVLRAENIVVRRRTGKHINYLLADEHVAELVFNALAHAGEIPARRGTARTDDLL
jgi:DNA-binding transcriptional ArsR family regulator